MNNGKLFKFTGHPLILFGEKTKDLKKRLNHIEFFHKKYFSNKIWKPSVKENSSKENFLKLESRKKRFQDRQINKEIYLYKRTERCSLFYKTNRIKDFEKKSDTRSFYSNFTFELIKKISLNHHFSCFQAGDTGLYSLRKPDKIILYDFRKNRIISTLYSNLYMLNYLSSNPLFPSCFLISNQKCSEFWRISSSDFNPTFESLYHKDLINFQKFRENGRIIDFGTLSMKWKCFDQVVQKYVFSRQFDETIINISTNEDSTLSAISTNNQIIIFDSRINKQISTIKLKNKQYSSIKWINNNSKLVILDKKVDIWNTGKNKFLGLKDFELIQNKKWNFITETKLINFERKKRWALLSEKLSNDVIQSINLKRKIKSWCQNSSNTMMALNITNKIYIFQKR